MNTTHKILNVQWFDCVGLVTIDDGYEIKTYCKCVNGIDEKQDIQDILKYGNRVFPTQLEAILYLHDRGHEKK